MSKKEKRKTRQVGPHRRRGIYLSSGESCPDTRRVKNYTNACAENKKKKKEKKNRKREKENTSQKPTRYREGETTIVQAGAALIGERRQAGVRRIIFREQLRKNSGDQKSGFAARHARQANPQVRDRKGASRGSGL